MGGWSAGGEAQDAEQARWLSGVGGVLDSVHDLHLGEVEGAGPFDAGDVDSVLGRVRPPLVVGVDAAGLAEVVFRCAAVEFIEGQVVLTCDEFDIRPVRRDGDGPPHSAIRAGAAADGVEPVRQPDVKPDRSAVAGDGEAGGCVGHWGGFRCGGQTRL